MSDTLSETQGCDLLARLFKARGYTLQRNVVFREYGVEFHIDGWDPKARVGFEFLTSEDDDHDDLSLEEYKTLTAAQRRGELALFIIDEVEPLSAADLAAEVHDFLDEVADAARARLKAAARRGKAAKKAVPATAKKKAKRKPASKRGAKAKVAAAAKPAARKKTVSKPPRKAVAKRRLK
jgi:hypothetical protein